MAQPDIIPGLNVSPPQGYTNEVEGRFFSSFPGSTPKFAMNRGVRRTEFTETMARLIVDVPRTQLQAMLNSLPADTRAAARTLLFSGDVTSFANGNAPGSGYFDFLLTQVSLPRSEREQVVDTLTDNTVIFYSGESAPVASCAGYFLNTFQDDQAVWFNLLYSDVLRGTMLAKRGLVARFRYDSYFLTGYLSNFVNSTTGDAKNYTQFQFSFRIKSIQIATPIIYNPTPAQSLLDRNIFVSDQAPGSDNTTRQGLEAAERPASPRALPAATRDADTDPRELANATLPARELQAKTDSTIATQLEAATAQLPTGEAGQVLDARTTPVVAARGDVRQQLSPSDAQKFQRFDTAAVAPTASTDPLTQMHATIERQLRAANTRGTALQSPTSGASERSGSYADIVARAPTTAVSQAEAANTVAQSPGSSKGKALDQDTEDMLDVYRPPGRLLAEYVRKGSEQEGDVRPRTRSRATG